MASVEQEPRTNGSTAGAGERPHIEVEDPATGQVIATVPDLSAPERRRPGREGARRRSPAGRRSASRAAARIMLRAQRWLIDNADRVIDDDRLRDRQGLGGRPARRGHVRRQRVRLLGQAGRRVPRRRAREVARPSSSKGKKLVLRYRPLGLVGVIGPWNYPLTNSFGDCIPALMAGNAVILKPSRGHPAHVAAAGRGAARVRACPTDVFQVATGRGETGAALVDQVDMVHVHRLDGDRQEGHGQGGRDAHARRAGARRQGPDDRPLRRRPRAGGEPAVYYSMFNGGQTCISIERVYVEAPVYDEFVAKVTEKARALRHDRPTGPGTDRRRRR